MTLPLQDVVAALPTTKNKEPFNSDSVYQADEMRCVSKNNLNCFLMQLSVNKIHEIMFPIKWVEKQTHMVKHSLNASLKLIAFHEFFLPTKHLKLTPIPRTS